MTKNSKFILDALERLVPNPKCPLNYTEDYELLLAVMLSAQTTDERVNMVTSELFRYDLKSLAEMDVKAIEDIIKPVGTQKRKSAYIKEISKILLEEKGGKVPYDREFVEHLPGVGHKTCNVVFAELFGEPTFAVDTHVSRVSKRLGLASPCEDVKKIEEELCKTFPKEKWARTHVQMVLFGRYICKAAHPHCENCPFKEKICKIYNK